jgi:hypothetical protein
VSYHVQNLSLPSEQQQAEFQFADVAFAGEGVRDFAAGLADHPRFARAWTQKLCEYANSVPCAEDDPEFLRVAESFRAGDHDFKTLVRELFSSPLVTQAAATKTSEKQGAVVTIARRDHFCAALQTRLGLPDACELKSSEPTLRQNLSFGIPGPAYARGAVSPLMPREPNLFFMASVENLCVQLAESVVDPVECPPGRRCFRSDRASAALDELAHVVMALPASDRRCAEVREILSEHYDDAIQAGYQAGDALKSAFVLACTSPLSSAIGL